MSSFHAIYFILWDSISIISLLCWSQLIQFRQYFVAVFRFQHKVSLNWWVSFMVFKFLKSLGSDRNGYSIFSAKFCNFCQRMLPKNEIWIFHRILCESAKYFSRILPTLFQEFLYWFFGILRWIFILIIFREVKTRNAR